MKNKHLIHICHLTNMCRMVNHMYLGTDSTYMEVMMPLVEKDFV